MITAIKYIVQIAESQMDAIREFLVPVQEVWVEQPNGKSFCFNEKNGIFFSDIPRIEDIDQCDHPEHVELNRKDVQAALGYLDSKISLHSVFIKK